MLFALRVPLTVWDLVLYADPWTGKCYITEKSIIFWCGVISITVGTTVYHPVPHRHIFLAFFPIYSCLFVSGWWSELFLIQLSGEIIGQFPFFNLFAPEEDSTLKWPSKKRYSCIMQALFQITRYFCFLHTSDLTASLFQFVLLKYLYMQVQRADALSVMRWHTVRSSGDFSFALRSIASEKDGAGRETERDEIHWCTNAFRPQDFHVRYPYACV